MPSLSLSEATWRILVEAPGAEGAGTSPGLGHPPARLVCHYCGLDSEHLATIVQCDLQTGYASGLCKF